MSVKRANILEELQLDIQRLEGHKPASDTGVDIGLGVINDAFPGNTFPLGAVHEFISTHPEDRAATSGFIAGILSPLMSAEGTAMWIGAFPKLFPPALKSFGVQPHRIIFIELKNERDVMWSMEEALKCSALSAVIGEMRDLDFTASRRLQLAVEHSRVTGFVIRPGLRKLQSTACATRWKITIAPSARVEHMPGVGFPQWKAELLKVRNGRPGSWELRWVNGQFEVLEKRSHANLDSFPYKDSGQSSLGKTG